MSVVLYNTMDKIKHRQLTRLISRSYVDLKFWKGQEDTSKSNVNNANHRVDSSSEFVTAPLVDGRYQSPWTNETEKDLYSLLKWQLTKKSSKLLYPKSMGLESHNAIKSVPVKNSKLYVTDRPHVTWIGHATCYFQTEGLHFITDPIFSDTCSPVEMFGKEIYLIEYDMCCIISYFYIGFNS